ncbi:hypothetical protein UlMin_035224 [Ulmus minor]
MKGDGEFGLWSDGIADPPRLNFRYNDHHASGSSSSGVSEISEFSNGSSSYEPFLEIESQMTSYLKNRVNSNPLDQCLAGSFSRLGLHDRVERTQMAGSNGSPNGFGYNPWSFLNPCTFEDFNINPSYDEALFSNPVQPSARFSSPSYKNNQRSNSSQTKEHGADSYFWDAPLQSQSLARPHPQQYGSRANPTGEAYRKFAGDHAGFGSQGKCFNPLPRRDWNLHYGNFIPISQNDCRRFQNVFDEGTYQQVQLLFYTLIDHVAELSMDPFGNYLVQKMVEISSEEQKMQILFMLTQEPGELVKISSNTHGTRVVQKLIESVKARSLVSLIMSALEPGFLHLMKDLNGNHVIQRCLQCLIPEYNGLIFDAAAKFCVNIATHRHGCCVLQKCIAHSTGRHQHKLVTEILKHGLFLAQDPFGNYVVQYLIEQRLPIVSDRLISQFKGQYVHLSMQKFSSHVVEKCLKHIEESQPRIIDELLLVPHFEELLQDCFANYVVQSALEHTKGDLHAYLVEAIERYKLLRTSPYCKRLFKRNWLKK